METVRLGHARITFQHEPLVAYTKWKESLKTNSSLVHCAGMTGVSKKPSEVTVTWSNAVASYGEEQDYRAAVIDGREVVMEIWETGGWIPTYVGILQSYDRDDGVDVDPVSDVAFVGVPI
ncbi:MAG: hypothetical protein JRG91_19200 [Deltaproteobacteria bacterium]|nr:hypothetical protein [Deltaproteobacteria bacterium]